MGVEGFNNGYALRLSVKSFQPFSCGHINTAGLSISGAYLLKLGRIF